MKHKRNDPMCYPWDSQGDEKNAVSISIAFCLDFLIRNENITSEERNLLPWSISAVIYCVVTGKLKFTTELALPLEKPHI